VSARVNVLGVGVSPINMSMALDQLGRWIAQVDRQYVSVCNVHSVMECRRDPRLRKIVNAAGMTTPDGMPLVWLARLSGQRHVSRVYGPDLMLAELQSSLVTGHTHYFYGGRPGVADRLAAAMRARFPGVRIAGTFSPQMGTAEELCNQATAAAINATGADIVWVGVSSPKQEFWMACMRPLLQAPVLIGVGAAFDFHSGTVAQAPRWMQRAGLEWLFRLLTDPRRLWRRYVIDNPYLLFELGRQKLGLKRFELE
jgi:N-acetylglucosaminyldiphosphoundecaprenol N-acetyl-beta-D-mannosaminyltransferase